MLVIVTAQVHQLDGPSNRCLQFPGSESLNWAVESVFLASPKVVSYPSQLQIELLVFISPLLTAALTSLNKKGL